MERPSPVLRIEEGSLYPALQRMLKDGWVKAEWGISSTNRRVRIYKLRTPGARHLEREVSSLLFLIFLYYPKSVITGVSAPLGKKELQKQETSFERMLEGIRRVLSPAES